MTKPKKLKVTLVKSTNGVLPKHKLCIQGLGLRRMRHSVIVNDEPCIRGMINKAYYLVSVEEA
jgi:large subunit ribosomal protein L30